MCSYCLVNGCAQCTWSSYTCYRCLDPIAILKNGKCFCPTNTTMNNQGFCESCLVDECDLCVSGNPNKCESCHPPFIKDTLGQCVCPSGKREVNNNCVDCTLSNCDECDTSPSTGVEVCTNCSGYYLLDGDTCTTCNIIGCLIC